MDTGRLTYLINGFRADLLTIDEQRELFDLVLEDAAGVETVPLFQEMLEHQEAEDADRDHWHPILQTILGADKPFPAHARKIIAIRRWVAAASIIAITLGLILWRTSPNALTSAAAPAVAKTDIPPGGNKALLTLAGGQILVLDSLHSGLLAQQGGARILKLSDGQLAYRHSQTAAVQYNTLATPRGGQYMLELADGTRVWLNAASSITYPTAFDAKTRSVKITGEAYFEVVHNSAQPFLVQAGGEEVQVLGTDFDINAYADEAVIRTTLLEGSVRVTRDGEELSLQPGQQAQAVPAARMTIKKDIDLEEVMAWKNGLFNFEGADLKTVLRQLSRWYDVDVVYEGAPTSRKFVGEMSRDLTLSQVLQGLGEMHLKFRIEGKKLIVTN